MIATTGNKFSSEFQIAGITDEKRLNTLSGIWGFER
jgi:hypothetical protein